MMPCVLRHGRVAAQATIAKHVDQDLPPHPEDAAHAIDEAGHLPPHLVVLPLPPQDAATLCSPTPPGYYVTTTLGHRMMQCVLPDAQPAEQARTAKKVDPTSLHLPGQMGPSLNGSDNVCNGLVVIYGQVAPSYP